MHNWFSVPLNYFGLYATQSEMYYLLNSASSFTPTNISVTIGQTIPTAKFVGTTTTIQLSFNNTIYSMIYENHDTENIMSEFEIFSSPNEFSIFRETSDGGRKDNSKIGITKS